MKTPWATLLLCLGLLGAASAAAATPAHAAAPSRRCATSSRLPKPASIRPPRATCTRTTSPRRSSKRCTPTTTWRGRPGWRRWRRPRCPRYRPTARPTPSASSTASCSRPIRRSRAQRRELTMADFVYSWKRLFDPKLASPHAWLFEGKVVGFDELAADAKKSGRFDYDAKVEGFELVDPYTLRIHLTQTDFNLGMILAHDPTSALAREVVAAYGDVKGEVASNPVGTGYYTLGAMGARQPHRARAQSAPPWLRPGISAGNGSADDQRIIAQMKGKQIGQIGRVEISVMVEDQSRWLSFQSGGADLFWLDGPLAPKAMLNGKLRPELAAKGVQLSRHDGSGSDVLLLEHAGPGAGRHVEGKNRLAARDRDCPQHRRGNRDRLERPGRAHRLSDSARRGGARPGVQEPAAVRSGAGQPAARPLRLQEGQGRLAHAAGRQAAGDPLRVAQRSHRRAAGRNLAQDLQLDRHPDGKRPDDLSATC